MAEHSYYWMETGLRSVHTVKEVGEEEEERYTT